ncbi:MAG: glutamate-5-semialdehyde dehydrogenase [Clostridia bacterium]|nr:glutamate-5-semialdehyde dehydrogenase [Clostridia bacterium]MDD4146044.1 glutamate-5-semialdehyde dehydrogenase [Clostridia bacterium]MDD4665781.1 glutamate-5-semialdehyde dehydrogenase [Clostridia bacterium]
MFNEELLVKGELAKEAAVCLAALSTVLKDQALLAMASALEEQEELILTANEQDVLVAKKQGMSTALLDRLTLTAARIKDMAEGLRAIAALQDPVGQVEEMWKGAQDIEIGRVRVPLGVIGIIYEARPNVTADAAGLCLKSGNAVILKGGSDALHSNKAITKVIAEAAENVGLPKGSIQLIENTSREVVSQLMKMNEYLDVLIPRGGAGLIRSVIQNATVPVIQTGIGNCHVYVDSEADLKMAEEIVLNAKIQRPGVCNALETLLVHEKVASEFLPQVAARLLELGVELRGDAVTQELVPQAKAASEEDYKTEFLDLVLAVKVVGSLDEAIKHIRCYGTQHSEAIVTESYSKARIFLQSIDAAAVYVNASTRFTDGFQFGYGAEIGISTQKLHARGPMGLKELTTIKHIIYGQGQVRK